MDIDLTDIYGSYKLNSRILKKRAESIVFTN